ncbi:MAG: DegV family protein, partial [Clostridia bacterium]|nr:DegV family protein [Clostridia bacterium]
IDSTANMKPELYDKVTVIPLTVHFKEEEYIDGVTITNEEFYQKLVEADELPRTSQVTPDGFMKYFEEVKEAGDEAVVITVASKLSGTCQSAMIAAKEYDNIYVVDSGNVAVGSGIIAEYAIKLAEEGKSAKEIKEILDKEKENVYIIAMVDTLKYLKMGGRISGVVAFVGGLLNIKPIVSVYDGVIQMIAKARGAKQGNQTLISEIEKMGQVDFSKPVRFGHSGLTDEGMQLFLENSKDFWAEGKVDMQSVLMGSVIGTHAGPGIVAIAFFKK